MKYILASAILCLNLMAEDKITDAEKSLGVVRIGFAMDGRPIAYYANGSFSYRADIEDSRGH